MICFSFNKEKSYLWHIQVNSFILKMFQKVPNAFVVLKTLRKGHGEKLFFLKI